VGQFQRGSAGLLTVPSSRLLLFLKLAHLRLPLLFNFSAEPLGTAEIVLFDPSGHAVSFLHAAAISLLLIVGALDIWRWQNRIWPTFENGFKERDNEWRRIEPRLSPWLAAFAAAKQGSGLLGMAHRLARVGGEAGSARHTTPATRQKCRGRPSEIENPDAARLPRTGGRGSRNRRAASLQGAARHRT
jgi:hypothetical protein